MAATSLRHQFVFPMLLAVLTTALGVTVCSKWFAERAARNATLDQLATTGSLCVHAKYPLTESVLTQIQELSSLRLAIVQREWPGTPKGSPNPSEPPQIISSKEGATGFRFESRSSSFPDVLGLDWIGKLTAEVAKVEGKPFLVSVQLADGTVVNATAYPLPSEKQLERERFLILVKSQASASTTSVQAFVLPMVTGLCSSIAIALVAAWVASGIGRRIEALGLHVEKIAGGSFETIAPTGPRDVIRTLYESVNSMSSQLQQSASQIAQNERSRMINLMASGLAHELRNHLTGARLAIQTCAPDPSTQEALSISLKQMQLAEESIQRLLTLRVDTADQRTPPMTIQSIYESVRDLILPIATHQRVDFKIHACSVAESAGASANPMDIAVDDIAVDGIAVDDGSSIVGALINLVLNAMEAAGPGGQVVVTTTHYEGDSKAVEWSVRDNGPGPSDEMATVMFEPFATTKREGVGLGLAMCKRIAQRQGGTVNWYRDNGFTVFTMRVGALTAMGGV